MKKILLTLIAVTRKPLARIAFLITAVSLIPVFVYNFRSPVLIVTDESFLGLYGIERAKKESSSAMLSLFRKVKTLPFVDEAGDDLISLTVSDTEAKPFCVLFPLRFVRAAKLYREQNPQVPVVLLEGRFLESETPSSFALSGNTTDYYFYKSDIEKDFYKAGFAAASLDKGKNGKIAFFWGADHAGARDAFTRGITDYKPPAAKKQVKKGTGTVIESLETPETEEKAVPRALFLKTLTDLPDDNELSCVVIVDISFDYMEKKSAIPVILFSWVNFSIIPDDVVLIVNDSPWAQIDKAVKLAASGAGGGLISSKFEVIKKEKFDNGTLRKIEKTW